MSSSEGKMSIFYSYTAVARQLSLNPAKLKRWCDYGLVKTQHKALLGDTLARLFTEEEIRSLKTAVELMETGTGLHEAFHKANCLQEDIES
jgi:hypothetical protein